MSQQHQPTGQESQQFQQGGMSHQGGTMGGSMGQQGMGQQGKTMSKTLPQSQWTALTSVAQAIAVCEFCADQCVQEADPMMIECIKLCEDVADIGKSVLSLVPHQSRNADQVISAFQQALQECAQECGQHEHAHCQECAQVLNQTLDSISQLQQGGMGQGTQLGSMGAQQGGMSTQQF